MPIYHFFFRIRVVFEFDGGVQSRDQEQVRHHLEAYSLEYGFSVWLADENGRIEGSQPPRTPCSCEGQSDRRRLEAAEQTLRWGSVVVDVCCVDGFAIWAAPIMNNARVSGAFVVQGVDLEAGGATARVKEASEALLELAVRENLTNSSALLLARISAERERERFLSLEATKSGCVQDDLRTIYLREEPALLISIKEGDIRNARAILNRILVGIYAVCGDRMEFLKSCIIELVVMMSRAAVEAGADPALLLGENYRRLSDLAVIHNEEDLATWVRHTLEALIEGIQRNTDLPNTVLLQKAFAYMREHLDEPLRRDQIARIAGISPSHFSKLVTERMGKSFTDLLTQMRIDRAKELIMQGDSGITAVALDCGFCDQSHLNKHFRKATGLSPGEYRRNRMILPKKNSGIQASQAHGE